MNSGDFLILAAILVYFAVVLFIGLYYTKRSNKSTKDYFLGGRSIGPWFTALSAEASDMSGYLLMALPGLAYWSGASDAGWTCIGLLIGTYLNWLLVAKRLRIYSEKAGESITIPSYLNRRFKDDKKVIGTIAALVILLFFCIYTGSCFVTCGKLFNSLFGFDYIWMMIIAAIVVFAYTIFGGYLSVVATDFVQGCLMFAALVIILIGSIAWAGGLENTVAFLQSIPGFLSMTNTAVPLDSDGAIVTKNAANFQDVINGMPVFGSSSEYGIITIISALSWGLGYFGMPQILTRFLSIRSGAHVKVSRRIAIVWVLVSMFAAVAIGIIGRATNPTEFLTNSTAENIFVFLSRQMLPSFLCGLVVSGILASSMSSSSAYMLIAGSSVAENIFRSVLKKDASDKEILLVSRVTLLVVFLFGILVASDENSIIFQIVSYAWAGLGSTIGPLILFSLYSKNANKYGAIAGLIVGMLTTIIWQNYVKPIGGVLGVYELLPAFVFACLAIYFVSKFTGGSSDDIKKEFDEYQKEFKASK